MIHTYSLIHDDLPAMDDDDLRRGRPTCHKKFGEAVAILAGDGLYAEAFSHLVLEQKGESEDVLAAVRELAVATGTQGMVGGQYADVVGGRGEDIDERTWIRRLHELKTGRLIRVSIEGVAILTGERVRTLLPGFRTYATELGLLFQIVDDILDVTGTDADLGKPSGSDARNEKLTYVSIYGLDRARELAAESHQRSLEALINLQQQNTVGAGERGEQAGGWQLLTELTTLIYSRSS
jgi:geranylgeranyl diphosphate synthase type II